jgi:hypothetical protein
MMFLALCRSEKSISGNKKYKVHSTPRDHAVDNQGAGHKVPGKFGKRKSALINPGKSQRREVEIETINKRP